MILRMNTKGDSSSLDVEVVKAFLFISTMPYTIDLLMALPRIFLFYSISTGWVIIVDPNVWP
ncbi:hypothetical protein ES702_03061 [subsurface metagenome]